MSAEKMAAPALKLVQGSKGRGDPQEIEGLREAYEHHKAEGNTVQAFRTALRFAKLTAEHSKKEGAV